ncbi:hypothetical protein GQ44DRAFT_832869 [Phaeosphaeriaceae sp. PMI808]|nr:hypothetical protein GQ44DRAFT_832869 [Phaeosphaeriaceae sp. PMI808]
MDDAQPTTNFRDAHHGAIWPVSVVRPALVSVPGLSLVAAPGPGPAPVPVPVPVPVPASEQLQPTHLARGRQPRDVLAKTIDFNVSSLDEFEQCLREYLDAPPNQPEHTEAQLSFWIGTSFMVSAPPHAASASNDNGGSIQQPVKYSPINYHRTSLSSSAPASASASASASVSASVPLLASISTSASASDPSLALTLPKYSQTVHVNDANASITTPTNNNNNDNNNNNNKSSDNNNHHLNLNHPTTTNGARKPDEKVSLSIMEALQSTTDPKDKMRKQRAIAKCCVDAIQRTDGYRYSFHNCWNSREDDSFRFSYYCNDSLLNKDRAANGKGAKLGKRATKPVFDCKGVLSIKFSATKQTLDVFYKHVPLHRTYEERAPPPRKDSKRRKYLEENDPEALARIATRPKQANDNNEVAEAETDALLSRKRKKLAKTETQNPTNTSLESDLRAQSLRSLLELIQVDPSPSESTPPEPPPQPPSLPPPLPQSLQHSVASSSLPIQHVSHLPVQQRRRPRNSCDICKAKKTKCNGTRPACQTCIDKKRQCSYLELSNGDNPRVEAIETVRHAQATITDISEFEKMKRELEEAKARIQELESEKQASVTPVHTPQMAPRPCSQPQPPNQTQSHHRPQHSQSQAQPQKQQRQVTHQHRQQLQQLNQNRPRGTSSPQQMAYKLDTPPQQQRVLNAQPSLQTPQQQIQPSQHMQSASQQLQVAAQQLQTGQHPQQLQTSQNYFNNTHTNHSPYGTMNRSMTQGSMPSQNAISPPNSIATQSNSHLSQTQPQGLTPTTTPVDTSNPYGRSDFTWPHTAYYGYQSAQQQQQQDQWGNARGSGVFR